MWGLRRPALLLRLLVLRSSARRLRHELSSARAEPGLRPWRLCRVRLAVRGAGPSRGSLKQPAAELRYWVHCSKGSGLVRAVVRVHLGGLTELGKLEIHGALCLPGGASIGGRYWDSGRQGTGICWGNRRQQAPFWTRPLLMKRSTLMVTDHSISPHIFDIASLALFASEYPNKTVHRHPMSCMVPHVLNAMQTRHVHEGRSQ